MKYITLAGLLLLAPVGARADHHEDATSEGAAQTESDNDWSESAAQTESTHESTQSAATEPAHEAAVEKQSPSESASESDHEHKAEKKEPTDRETLFGQDTNIDWFLGGGLRATTVDRNMGMMLGIRGGMLAMDSFSLALAGYITVVDPRADVGRRNDRKVDMGYAGFEVGYYYKPLRMVHFGARSLFAVGAVGHRSDGDAYAGPEAFWVIEPGGEMVLNLWKHLDLSVGAGYRFAFGVDDPEVGLVVNRGNGNNNLVDGLNVDIGASWKF